jgi:predicted lysophospholipase L1 biosynthesis ABC-type transport system permease subunit
MPAGFDYSLLWGQVDAWRPAAFSAEQRRNRGNHWLNSMARLKPGISIAQAEAELRTIVARLVREHEPDQAHTSIRLIPLRASGIEETGRRISWMTFGLAGFVLLITCANLANLQLARLSSRAREFAVRAALGARRSRLMRALLTESLVLALAGGLAGLLVALWCNDWLGRRILVGDQAGLAVPLTRRC